MGPLPTYTAHKAPQPIDWQLLTLILDAMEAGRPSATVELAGRFHDHAAALDGLVRLQENGLTTSVNAYVLPTRAAIFYRLLERLNANPHQLRLRL